MFTKLTLGAVALAAVALANPTSAAPLMTQTPAADSGLVHQTEWYGGDYRYCRHWRHECASRWGWGTGQYYRCLWRHGCGRG